MSRTINTLRPAYEISVRDAFVDFITAVANGAVTYGDEIYRLPVIKSINVSPESSTKKVYASGVTYAVTNHVSGATIDLGVVALPSQVLSKALGELAAAAGKPELVYLKTDAQGDEFGFGYICDESDGNQVFYWHPRCKLVLGDEEHQTSEDEDPDPEVSYSIEVMPTDEKVWKVRYSTGSVEEGVTPMTPEAFFEAAPYTIAQIQALVSV